MWSLEKVFKKSVFLLATCVFFYAASNMALAGVSDDSPYSSISVKVKMKKVNFKIGEEVLGIITLENKYPANLPAVFKVKLYHDGYYVSEVLTSLKSIPMGNTKFSLREFGVPEFNMTRDSVGRWDIKIMQQGVNERYSKTATVHIIAQELNKEKKR